MRLLKLTLYLMKLPHSHSYLQSSAFLVLFIYSIINVSSAQQVVFTPASEDIYLLQKLSSKYEKVYRDGLATLPQADKNDFEKIYKHRWDNIKEKFDDKEIYTEAVAQIYLDALVAEIVKGNPALNGNDFKCFFSRSGIPNASYLGEGIILVNMGLFHRLGNESQVAFVLCHEIAHFQLKHSENSIKKYVATINSKEVQQELQKIKGSEYRKGEQLEKLVKGLTFNNSRHSRDRESEADSFAVELLRNTRFDVSEALSTLEVLDQIDTDTLDVASCLQRIFNAKNYPFQKKWIAKEEGLLGGHALLKDDQQLADSLKTHPDCKLRMEALHPVIRKYSNTSSLKNVIDKARFEELRNIFRYEIVAYAFTSNNYTRCLHNTLELLQRNPSDPYLVAQVGKLMNGFYAAQKSHTLSKFVDLPSPAYPSNYNLLLQFVQNLYAENFASLSYHFLNRFHPQLEYYEPFRNEYKASIQIAQE